MIRTRCWCSSYGIHSYFFPIQVLNESANAALRPGLPRLVRNELPRVRLAFANGYDSDKDAMLVAAAEGDTGTPEEIRVVVDWFQELERLTASND